MPRWGMGRYCGPAWDVKDGSVIWYEDTERFMVTSRLRPNLKEDSGKDDDVKAEVVYPDPVVRMRRKAPVKPKVPDTAEVAKNDTSKAPDTAEVAEDDTGKVPDTAERLQRTTPARFQSSSRLEDDTGKVPDTAEVAEDDTGKVPDTAEVAEDDTGKEGRLQRQEQGEG